MPRLVVGHYISPTPCYHIVYVELAFFFCACHNLYEFLRVTLLCLIFVLLFCFCLFVFSYIPTCWHQVVYITINFLPFLPRDGLTSIQHHAQFLLCWQLNSVLQACEGHISRLCYILNPQNVWSAQCRLH